MKNIHHWKRVHLVGIGGINMSAVAKILLKTGIAVSGSDVKASEVTDELVKLGVRIAIGPHDERNIPVDCEGVIHTSAAPDSNPERVAAKNRHIPDIDNFQWMGLWFREKRMVLVTGTHGKSTVTALLGLMCIDAGLDPTVIVGSRLTDWPDRNLRLGSSDLVILEGDEYAKHFLEFHPYALIINNLELDHTDVYKNIDELRKTFERLLRQTRIGATVVVNGEYAQIEEAVKPLKATRKLDVIQFGRVPKPTRERRFEAMINVGWKDAQLEVGIDIADKPLELTSKLIGAYNGLNLAAAALMARHLGASDAAIQKIASTFTGIWRRMELLGEQNGAIIYSDYGHHPTAVASVLDAVRQAYPDNRIVLCFQPHHKNRTKHLWNDFVTCFDRADVLILCEIYDVAGRAAAEDANVTSQKLLDEVRAREVARPLDHFAYAPDPESAITKTFALLKEGDVCIFMGAGDIDGALRAKF